MSEDMTKSAIRLELPDMEGRNRTALLRKVERILGPPRDVDDDMDSPEDDNVFYFEYDEYDFVTNGKRWAVDMLLSPVTRSYEHDGIDVSMDELKQKAKELADKFGRKVEDCRLVCYSWYNGIDEPVKFGDADE